jgi:hemoglobin
MCSGFHPLATHCSNHLPSMRIPLFLGCILAPFLLAFADDKPQTKCPVTGRPVDPAITAVYEGRTYAFADSAARGVWTVAREKSLYQRLGGGAAVEAAVDAFYVRVLGDERIRDFFENINMNKQRRKQKEFLSAAFGGPDPWSGKDLRSAHSGLELKEEHFLAVAENLQKTLEEMEVPKELVAEVMAIAASTKDTVLNRK